MAVKINKKAIIKDFEARGREAVKNTIQKIQDDSLEKTPEEDSDLRDSAGNEITDRSLPVIKGRVYYTEDYSLWVHESVEMKLEGEPRPSGKGVYWGPNGEAKFLEKATFNNRDTFEANIRKEFKKIK